MNWRSKSSFEDLLTAFLVIGLFGIVGLGLVIMVVDVAKVALSLLRGSSINAKPLV